MKKIDLHLHTIPTASDRNFIFSLDRLKQYVEAMALDAIAITNHNTFDISQFRSIADTLPIPVFPGIEINVDSCHILVIAEPSKCDAFEVAAQSVESRIAQPTDDISAKELLEIFHPLHLNDLLIIPHIGKKPAIRPDTLATLTDYVFAGEVDSAKKFVRYAKDTSGPVPVLFSDARVSAELVTFPTRHTFIDCGEVSLAAIKSCLRHHEKVSLSKQDGNALFQVMENGLMISTGLNILLGERSSGKTYTLDRIHEEQPNTKYIKQFSLVQTDEEKYAKHFTSEVDRQRSRFTEEYLTGFKAVVDDILSVDLA